MNTALACCESNFIKEHFSDFTDRFHLGCATEGLCSHYCIIDCLKQRQISSSLVVSLNTFSRQIHVSRFYPELYKEPASKYMSATCFFLLVHHFAQSFHLDERYSIYLEARNDIFHDFYEKLSDFDLTVKKPGMGSGNVDILGHYIQSSLPLDRLCRNNPCPLMED